MKAKVRVSSTDRTFGTLLGSRITKECGNSLAEDTVLVQAEGGGGQSFGAFIPKGMTIRLAGDCNDYFGKGLSGGKLVLHQPRGSRLDPGKNIIVGNVALYGATSGEAYIGGVAGERFCVRNSGAEAVVEGVGDHGCEYMTGGCVVILGETGRNFAAGMSGGTAYVLDRHHDLYRKLNKELVTMGPVRDEEDTGKLKSLIEKHVSETGSPCGKDILEHWETMLPLFKKVIPTDYANMRTAIRLLEKRGISRDQAELEAFYTVQKGNV